MTSLYDEFEGVPKENRPRPPISDCRPRRLYRIACRNLNLGVFDGKDGFIGIREKFGHRYLFTEYHWEVGPPYGTVTMIVDTGIDVPDNIELREYIEPDHMTNVALFEWLDGFDDKGQAKSDG